VALVDDHVHPTDFAEHGSVLDDVFVCREKNLERSVAHLRGLDVSTSLRATFVCDNSNTRCPSLKLKYPIWNCRQRDDDEEGAVLSFLFY
jgi:hypothetical protein